MIPFNRLGLLFKLFSAWIYPRKVMDDLATLLEGIEPGGFVLDLGAGAGAFTQFAHAVRKDLKYIALDPAYGMVRYAPRYAGRVMAKAEELPFKSGLFSAVLIGDSIHHFEAPHKAVMEIKYCMKTDGKIFIFDMNPDTFIGGWIYKAEKLLKEPGNFYSPGALCNLLTQHGFVCTVRKYDWRYSVAGTAR